MPVPVFDHVHNHDKDVAPKMKEKTSAAAIFFAVFLVFVSIFTVELFISDMNRRFNNEYDACHTTVKSNSLFQTVTENSNCDLQRYEGIRLFIHIDVLIPIVVTGFIFIFVIRKKNLSSYGRVLRTAFSIFILWLSIRMVSETEYYLIKHEPIIGKYIVLLTIILLLIYLVILLQRRFAKNPI
ncbi:MAG: hypothetical protein Q8P20_08495 [bacterium]|nr:hypothetical protein [bacterium]